jgi:predicted nucleic acid-binding Zn ribbon protein
MPTYVYKCPCCMQEYEAFKQYKHRAELPLCNCQGTLKKCKLVVGKNYYGHVWRCKK